MNLSIQKAKPQDAEAIAEVQLVTWLDTYPNAKLGITKTDILKRLTGEQGERTQRRIDNWRKSITVTDGSGVMFVARLDDRVVGFTYAAITSNGQHRIGALYVLPEAQGHGIGAQLMLANLAWHGEGKAVYSPVAAYNRQAINFYKKFGFIETGNTMEDLPARKRGLKELPEIELVRPAR